MHITNQISRIFGKFSKQRFPNFIQSIINNAYAKLFHIDMSEFKNPNEYETLNALFTRKLEKPRTIDKGNKTFISPSDSLITQCGTLENETLLQIKGMSYNLEDLLTYYCKDNAYRFINGEYMNFYLSPKDYHRYHAPLDCQIKRLIHIPGTLYPVNLKYLNKQYNLFIQNERVILECEINNHIFYMIFVGALNVGEMVFEFEPRVETNKTSDAIAVYEYDNLFINKGDCVGYFKMGSTIVMLWEKDFVNIEPLTNEEVKYGDFIATIKAY